MILTANIIIDPISIPDRSLIAYLVDLIYEPSEFFGLHGNTPSMSESCTLTDFTRCSYFFVLPKTGSHVAVPLSRGRSIVRDRKPINSLLIRLWPDLE